MRRLVGVGVGIVVIVAIVVGVLMHQVHKANKTFHLVATSTLSSQDQTQVTKAIENRARIASLGNAKVSYNGKKVTVYLPESTDRQQSLSILVATGTTTVNPVSLISSIDTGDNNPGLNGKHYELQAPVITNADITNATSDNGLTLGLTAKGVAACKLLGATEAADYADPNGGNQSALVLDGIVIASQSVKCSDNNTQYAKPFDSGRDLAKDGAIIAGGAYPSTVQLGIA